MWRTALRKADIAEGRLFHDLRRSAVRTLIRSGVDPTTAMKVSGHRTRSMLDRYNIIDADDTAAAFAKADAYLSTQPTSRNVESFEKRDRTGTMGPTPTGKLASAQAKRGAGDGTRTHTAFATRS